MPSEQIYTGALLPNARLLSKRIAAPWEFPVTVSIAIEQASPAAAPPLAQVLAADDPRVLQGLDPAGAACFEKLSNEED